MVRDKIGITVIEEELNTQNSRSCNLEKFNKYVDSKIKANEELIPEKYRREYKIQ